MGRHAAPALTIERDRLEDDIGGSCLGICGDEDHSYGFHLPADELPSSDYSMDGAINDPDDPQACCAIDIGMDWPASRDWLAWLIAEKQAGRMPGVLEVIGSYDGSDVRYWSWLETPDWPTDGDPYTGTGHDRWTHVAIARSMTSVDHGILDGWTADGRTDVMKMVSLKNRSDQLLHDGWTSLYWDTEYADPDGGHADDGGVSVLREHAYFWVTTSCTIPDLAPTARVEARLVQVESDGEGGYTVVQEYPVAAFAPISGDTNIHWTQVGTLQEARRLRAQVRIVPDAPAAARSNRMSLLYQPR